MFIVYTMPQFSVLHRELVFPPLFNNTFFHFSTKFNILKSPTNMNPTERFCLLWKKGKAENS